jgi:basic amino acid/polyamine antiporter, APA family
MGVPDPGSRLDRSLGTADAVAIGWASMVGAGIFAALGPAAAAAGAGLLIGLALAGAVAFANATSSAQLAAVHPVSGGTYAYARRELGRYWGYLSGWAFVVGKVASCAAIALTFGRYVWPSAARPLAALAVAGLAAVNLRGIGKTARLTWFLVLAVFASLLVAVVAMLAGAGLHAERLSPLWPPDGVWGILRSGALLFFAFAGYARVATLGEEVRDPARSIPRAIAITVSTTLVLYAAVALAALMAAGPRLMASSAAPLEAAVRAAGTLGVVPVVRIGAALATLGVLLSLLAGVSRTVFAMAADRELPTALAAVHPRFRVPNRALAVVALAVLVVVALVPLARAIEASAFTVLLYYGLTNASALALRREQRRWPRWLSWFGLAGCVALAFSLPSITVLAGGAALAAASLVYAARARGA